MGAALKALIQCKANMRDIKGAVLMYRKNEASAMYSTVELALLIEKGYLLDKPKCPCNGNYCTHISADKDLRISCTVHNFLEADGEFKGKDGDPVTEDDRREMALLKKRTCVSQMKMMQSAVELYLMEHKGPTNVSGKTLVMEGYLTKMPECPSNGRYCVNVGPENRVKVSCEVHATIGDVLDGL